MPPPWVLVSVLDSSSIQENPAESSRVTPLDLNADHRPIADISALPCMACHVEAMPWGMPMPGMPVGYDAEAQSLLMFKEGHLDSLANDFTFD